MSDIVRSLTRRMASFSSLKERAASQQEQEHRPHREDTSHDTTTTTMDSIESLEMEPLTPPVMSVSRFDNMIQGLKRRVSIKQLRVSSDPLSARKTQAMPTTSARKTQAMPTTALAHHALASSPSISTEPAITSDQQPAVQSQVWEVLRGGKLTDRSAEQLSRFVRVHMIDVDIDHTEPETLLPNLKELSIVSSTPANIHALSPLLPQLTDLWLNDVLGFPHVPRSAETRAEYKQNLIDSLSAFADNFKQYLMNSYDISGVAFKEPDFHGYLRFVHRLSNLTFPETIYNPRTFFQRPPVLQITTLPRGFLQDESTTIDRPVIEDIDAPALRELQLHVIGQFPRVRRFNAHELKEVTLVFSSIQEIDMFEKFTNEDISFLLGTKKIKYKGDLALLKRLTMLLEEYTGGFSLEVFTTHDEQVLKELHFRKATAFEVTTRTGRTPWVNAPLVRNFTIVYQNPSDPVQFMNVSSCFPLLETLEIKSKDSKALAMKEPPLVTLTWMDRGNFSNLETIHMSSRTRLHSGFFTHAFPALRQAKLTTLSSVLEHGLSQWTTPMLEELELYVDYSKQVGEIGDVALVVSGYRCLRELYVKGITTLIIENCPYLELINSRYAGPMKSLNVTGSCILRGLVYDSPGGKIVDNVSKECDRFVREYKKPVRNYYMMVYDSFFTAFPNELEEDIMTKGRLF